MTGKDYTWNPHSDIYKNQENDMIDYQGGGSTGMCQRGGN